MKNNKFLNMRSNAHFKYYQNFKVNGANMEEKIKKTPEEKLEEE